MRERASLVLLDFLISIFVQFGRRRRTRRATDELLCKRNVKLAAEPRVDRKMCTRYRAELYKHGTPFWTRYTEGPSKVSRDKGTRFVAYSLYNVWLGVLTPGSSYSFVSLIHSYTRTFIIVARTCIKTLANWNVEKSLFRVLFLKVHLESSTLFCDK